MPGPPASSPIPTVEQASPVAAATAERAAGLVLLGKQQTSLSAPPATHNPRKGRRRFSNKVRTGCITCRYVSAHFAPLSPLPRKQATRLTGHSEFAASNVMRQSPRACAAHRLGGPVTATKPTPRMPAPRVANITRWGQAQQWCSQATPPRRTWTGRRQRRGLSSFT